MKYAISSNEGSIARIQEEYQKSDVPWYIGFSGGKDSSAVLKLTFLSLMQVINPIKPVVVIYCDTGVDIPIINELVLKTLTDIRVEAKEYKIPLENQNCNSACKRQVFFKGYWKRISDPDQ